VTTTRPPAPTTPLPRALHPAEPPFDPDYDTPAYDNTLPDTPAQDNAAEQSALGAMLIAPKTIDDVTAIIQGTDYYRPAHETIHNTIVDLHHHGQPVDPVTVAAALTRTGDLERIGGAPYLHTLVASVPIATNAAHYAEIVRDTARRRTIYDVGTHLRQLGTNNHATDLEQALDHAYQRLDQAAAYYGPHTSTPAATGLADLTWILTGQPPNIPPPLYGTRTDGNALFYAGKINGLFGDPECGKTWLAQAAIVEHLNNGGTAAMIDVDHNGPDHTAARLLLLGAHPNHIADTTHFRYYEPDDGDQLRAAINHLTTSPADIVLIDSLGETLPLLGANANDGDEVTAAIRATAVPLADTGSCVITIDHLPKSTEARTTGYAIGSIAKKRMMRGSYLRVDAITQPAPGQTGRIALRIEKDTAGKLRQNSHSGYAGTFTLNSTQPGITTWQIELETTPTNPDGTMRPTHLMEKISRFIEDNDQCKLWEIEEAITGKTKWIRVAVRLLIDEGFVSSHPGPRNAKVHHSIAHYREAEDDNA